MPPSRHRSRAPLVLLVATLVAGLVLLDRDTVATAAAAIRTTFGLHARTDQLVPDLPPPQRQSTPPVTGDDPPAGGTDQDDPWSDANGYVLDRDGHLDVEATARLATAVDAGRIHPGLEAALDRARAAASQHGLEIPLSSAHRGAMEQSRLLATEIAERGSLHDALRWVFPPARSMHVRGLAIDVNSGPAADWLLRHGARFGLCKTLDWEWWHFEWRQRWEDAATCPSPARTPAEAPQP